MSTIGLARTFGFVVVGVDGHVVEVEADVSSGVVGFTVVGLADKAVGEARDRARSALQNSGLTWPSLKITIGLSPAWLPKRGPTLDLPVALALASTQGTVPAGVVTTLASIGELGLDGRIRPVRGVLVAALAARAAGHERLIVPAANLAEAALVPGLRVEGYFTLAGLVASLRDEPPPAVELDAQIDYRPPSAPAALAAAPDLRDLRGQHEARAALELAAAGGHHLLMSGPPGIGKTMLACRLPGILPPLDEQQSLEVSAVHSVAGQLGAGQLISVPPFVAPHHTTTHAALVGGGSLNPQIGQVALAHHGVLFLDEAPEFDRPALEALRQPLESGVIVVMRSAFTVRYPARFSLVLAMNPCPCGRDGSGRLGAGAHCTCTSVQRRRYAGRISGPLVDRVDLRVLLSRPTAAELGAADSDSSAIVAERVAEARARAVRRLAATGYHLNGQVPGPVLRRRFPLGSAAAPLDAALSRGALSARGADRVARVAWTVADLGGRDAPSILDVGTALSYRETAAAWAA